MTANLNTCKSNHLWLFQFLYLEILYTLHQALRFYYLYVRLCPTVGHQNCISVLPRMILYFNVCVYSCF